MSGRARDTEKYNRNHPVLEDQSSDKEPMFVTLLLSLGVLVILLISEKLETVFIRI